ncbi:MAG: hypothetical protein VB114_05185 [Lutispora sp.]|nr:hypothetical protein [Lutispora sp.]MEA4961040.1 hypothetical protein [Lutispora sp.]
MKYTNIARTSYGDRYSLDINKKEKAMIAEKIKQMSSKDIFLKILLPIILLIVLIFYFKAFFTIGAYYERTFLVKEVAASDNHYIGKSKYGDIHITVKGLENEGSSAEVIYRLPNNINKQYIVNFKNAENWGLGIENIEDEDGNIIFEGEYQKGSQFMFDKNGEPLMDYADVRVSLGLEAVYSADYKVSLKSVADFASFANDTIRGEYEYLILAIILFLIIAIDIKYPLFFFELRHCLDVRDPEPSDFYIAMQRISWVAYPIIGIVLMAAAIY